jgi:hypothetical protein
MAAINRSHLLPGTEPWSAETEFGLDPFVLWGMDNAGKVFGAGKGISPS